MRRGCLARQPHEVVEAFDRNPRGVAASRQLGPGLGRGRVRRGTGDGVDAGHLGEAVDRREEPVDQLGRDLHHAGAEVGEHFFERVRLGADGVEADHDGRALQRVRLAEERGDQLAVTVLRFETQQ